MSTSLKPFLTALFAALSALVIAGHAQDVPLIQPHEETQRLLRQILLAPEGHVEREFERNRAQLDRLMAEDGVRFVLQTIVFEANHDQPREFAAYYFLRDGNISGGEVASALSTLMYCPDARLRREARRLFPRVLREVPKDGQIDLSYLGAYIAGAQQMPEVSVPLKRALFELVPAGTCLFYTGEFSTGEIERSDVVPYRRRWRVIDNALFEKKWLGGIRGGKVDAATTAALMELASSNYWWARLFVAEVVVQNSEFRNSEVVGRLRADSHDLVRKSIGSLDNIDPLRVTPVDP